MRTSKEISEQLNGMDATAWEAKKVLYEELTAVREHEEAERQVADKAAGRTNACGHSWETRAGDVLHCSYCGSISVSDAIAFLKATGTHFSGADHKYGWPHKFYIEPVDPNGQSRPIKKFDYDKGDYVDAFYTPRLNFKFYNKHLLDATPEQFAEFRELSSKCFGIYWNITVDEKTLERQLRYGHPPTSSFHGYQLAGEVTADGVKHTF